ncbi:MAG TPA: sulfite exporter TauE/SafE family protein [Candidatus Saccharimonadales bacterium]|nr:sulfite exporter TauE/SafE family protein [Candidatus Saccharimonadales bacterium]
MIDLSHSFFPEFFQWWHIPFLFMAGLIGEGYGALVGGGSLVTQPALLVTGLPLHSVLAIDATGPIATEAGILTETRKDVVKRRKLVLLMAIPVILGGILGTHLLITTSPEVIKYIMVGSILLILGDGFITNKKRRSTHVSKERYAVMMVSMFVISVYTIFIGLGEGTFGRLALMITLGLTFVQSQGISAAAKMPARIYALVITAMAGLIVWPYLLTFWCSNFIAGKYDTKLIKKIPDKYMRTLMFIVSVAFAIYLLFYY